jgi:hypothetical protein
MNKRKKTNILMGIVYVAVVAAIVVPVLYLTLGPEYIPGNKAKGKAVDEIIENCYNTDKNIIDLNEILPFDWDRGYIVSNTTYEEILTEVMGADFDSLRIELTNTDIDLYWCFFEGENIVFQQYLEYDWFGSLYDMAYEKRNSFIVSISPDEAEIEIFDIDSE